MMPLSAAVDKIQKTSCVFFDFDGVFTDNRVLVDSNGIESVACWRSDGLGVSKLKKINFYQQIISTEINEVVSIRAKKMGIECSYGIDNKFKKMCEILEFRQLSLEQTIYVGNDINDLLCLETVGVPIIVADANEDVRRSNYYQTTRNGGYGAVREICDFIYSIFSH
jgi:YrbI family 3-deoxy-D-manno-octulosonate 8-phosphate phosphatase